MPYVNEMVKSYFRSGFSYKEMISLLAHKCSVATSIGKLKGWWRKLHLVRRKIDKNLEQLAGFIQN